jgi:KDO2-lipid IV(A) lauroyltransferase
MKIFSSSMTSFARVLVDFLRLPNLNEQWFRKHVKLFGRTPLEVKGDGSVGVLYVTGHLGSFEILAHYCAVFGYPLSFIARDLPLKSVSAWVRAGREKGGNKMISRDGATKEVLRYIEGGSNVGILFDQNVTRKHAVFVPWFGKLAATARTVGLVSVRTRCPVVVVSIKSSPATDSYEIVTEEVDLSDIYGNEKLDLDSKILEVTRRVSDIFVEMIRKNPTEWFWMHRRWKTSPEGFPEDFYC